MMKKLFLTLITTLVGIQGFSQVSIYFEDFEGATTQTYEGNLTPVAINGLTGWEFVTTEPGGRLQTNVGVAHSGTQAMTLDDNGASLDPENELILTYDMSTYTNADSVELHFWMQHDGEEDDPGDRVWVRGDNSSAWIEVIDWDPILSASNDDTWLDFTVDLDSAMQAGGQTFSGTFQISFGQMDNSPYGGLDGIIYDDVELIAYEYGVNFVNANEFVCFDAQDGFAVAAGVLGNPPYSYAWDNGGTTDSIGGLVPGTYCVTITDASSETTTACIDIVGGDSIFLDANVNSPLVCKYDVSEVQAIGSGGTPVEASYSMDTNSANYAWDSTSNCNALMIPVDGTTSDLNIGFDFIFYGDTFSQFQVAANGFIGFGGGLSGSGVPSTIPSTATPNNAIYFFRNEVDFVQGGYSYCMEGTAPFRRLIVNFSELGDETTGLNFNGQIIIYETTNCIEIQSDYVTFAGGLVSTESNLQGIENADGTEASAVPGRNAEPFEVDDAYVQFCPLDSSGLQYEWSNGFTSASLYGLDAGTYTVTATDAMGCTVSTSLTLDPAQSSLDLVPDISDVSCFGFNDGMIASNETGGSGNVTFMWSDGQTTEDATDLDGGTYSVTASDNLGCVDSLWNLVVIEPEILLTSIYDVISPNCPSDNTGSAVVTASGGRLPYTYGWSNGEPSASATNLKEGTYQVTVTDSSGCESVESVNMIAENKAPFVDLGPDIYNQSGAAVTLSSGNSNVLWSTTETTPNILVTSTGTYWVKATNAAGCSTADTIFVEIWPNGLDDVQNDDRIAIFPNPTSNQLNLRIAGNSGLDNVQLIVTDIKGVEVMHEVIRTIEPDQVITLDASALAKGAYNIAIQSETTRINSAFIKR